MAKKFEIQKQSFGSVAEAYNDLLGIKSDSQIVFLPVSQLDEIEDQPFPINASKVDQIADSIDNVGVIEPIIVVKNGERYNILSGRHRYRACKQLGKTEIPCYVKVTDDITARYILIATNTDRNNEYSPMVYARAYAEQLELMKKLGKKSAVNAIAEQNGINRKQIYRYLRLNYLIPEIQKMVENKILTIEAAVELSFLSDEKQTAFYNHINELGIADNVISRNFKVEKTKMIRQTAEELSDEEFTKNLDKIIFGNYGQENITAVTEPKTEDISTEKETKAKPIQAKKPVSDSESKKEKMGLEAPKTERKDVPSDNDKPENSFEEIVKGYMLLALLDHGMDSENISIAQLDATFDKYTKSDAAEVYRREM